MNKKTAIWGFLQIGITFIITIYIHSIATKEVLFFNDVFSARANSAILNHPLTGIIILGAFNLLCFVFSHQNQNSNIYNNICKSIFDDFIKKTGFVNHSEFRVSLFTVMNMVIMKRKFPFIGLEKRLVLSGRAQKRQQIKKTTITFAPGEGCVGISYATNSLIKRGIKEYNENAPDSYITDSSRIFKLPAKKVKRLNEKACEFLCIPIDFFITDSVFGVLVIDSMKVDLIDKIGRLRDMEMILLHFGAFFAINKQ